MSIYPFWFWDAALSSPELSSCSRQACSSFYIYQRTSLSTGWIYFGANLYLSPISTGSMCSLFGRNWRYVSDERIPGYSMLEAAPPKNIFFLRLLRVFFSFKCFLQGACCVRPINTSTKTEKIIWKEDRRSVRIRKLLMKIYFMILIQFHSRTNPDPCLESQKTLKVISLKT